MNFVKQVWRFIYKHFLEEDIKRIKLEKKIKQKRKEIPTACTNRPHHPLFLTSFRKWWR